MLLLTNVWIIYIVPVNLIILMVNLGLFWHQNMLQIHYRSNTLWSVILRNTVYHELAMDPQFSFIWGFFGTKICCRYTIDPIHCGLLFCEIQYITNWPWIRNFPLAKNFKLIKSVVLVRKIMCSDIDFTPIPTLSHIMHYDKQYTWCQSGHVLIIIGKQ